MSRSKQDRPFAERTVVVLHGEVPPDAPPDDQDTLDEVNGVVGALEHLGYEAVAVPLSLDLAATAKRLTELAPRFVFNLVEAVANDGQLIYLGTTLLDHLEIPYTGAPTEAMFMTTNKLVGKRMLDAAGLPTPPWFDAAALDGAAPPVPGPWIVKDAWEHASIAVHDESIVRDEAAMRRLLERWPCSRPYVEQYIDGREFNLALLGKPDGEGEVLPISEIRFVDYPEGKPKIVDYRAKWDMESFEYHHTPRYYEFPPEDDALLAELHRLSLSCWKLFGLKGYARVDFRVDTASRPLIMEINANPCIGPESGFSGTAEEVGLDYPALVDRIVRSSIPAERLLP